VISEPEGIDNCTSYCSTKSHHGKEMLTVDAAARLSLRGSRAFSCEYVIEQRVCLLFKVELDIRNISCKAGEMLTRTSHLLLSGERRKGGETRVREREVVT